MDDQLSTRGRDIRLVGVALATLVILLVGLSFAPPVGPRRSASDPIPTSAVGTLPGGDGSVPSGTPGAQADPLRLALAEPSATWQPGGYEPDTEAVQALLDRRAEAVKTHDVDAYVATASMRAGIQSIARTQAAAIEQLPVTDWYYTLGADDPTVDVVDPAATTEARGRYGPDVYVVRVVLRYRLGGYDRDIVSTTHRVTLAHDDDTWSVLDDAPSDGSREIWDFGPLTVAHGAHSLVVGFGSAGSSPARLRAYASAADAGVSGVDAVWGTSWQREVLVVAPSTRGELAQVLDRPSVEYRQIAAVTTARLASTTSVSHGDRIFVNPKAFASLGPRGRAVVLRHETTHVATVAAAADQMPTWMEEGFADYIGYRGSGVPEAAITQELSTWVASGARPRSLPTDEDYDGSNGHLVETYEESYVAARMIADAYGQEKLVELYRAMREYTAGDQSGGTDDAFRSVLDISLASFTRDWRARVQALAG